MILKKINSILETEGCESFSIAFLFHSLFLLLLSIIFCSVEHKITQKIIVFSPVETIDIEDPIIIVEEQNFNENNTSFILTENNDVSEDSSLKIDDIDTAQILEPTSTEQVAEITTESLSENFSGLSSITGGGVSFASSTNGALDRLTLEIIRNAETKDLNVVWLFDASVSLTHQRQQIHDRFTKVIEELDIISHNRSIVHSICSFGSSITFLTDKPNNNVTNLKRDISSVSTDNSGIENTFSAVLEVCKKYTSSSKRLMIIIFTDEVGDDINNLDKAIDLAKSKGSMIYAVGSPAPFGKSSTQFRFVEFDPKYESAEKWVEINQGPETLYDMILDLRSLPIDEETLDSGFGPFAISKLCVDTGGIFFSVHPNRKSDKVNKQSISPLSSYISRFFDHDIMIQYRPDYRPVPLQNKENLTHISKTALLKACSIPLHINGHQTLRFRAFNEGTFAEELGMAQRFSAKLEPQINQIYNILLSGEPAYHTLKDKRWIASYALAMGRILCTKCRIESYNLILAEAKSGLKKSDPKSNIWTLRQSKEFSSSNSVLRKNYETSQKYLKYVVDNFPDTPWALIAQEELDTPIGYVWVESYEPPPKPTGSNVGRNQPQDDKAKPKLAPKPSRKIDKI